LKTDGLQPEQISGQDLRVAVGRTLGWQFIKSATFAMTRESGVYRFKGQGSGHGVGMCVIGAAQLAVRGRETTQILEKYFPGLRVSRFDLMAAPSAVTFDAPRSGPVPAFPSPPAIVTDAVVVTLPAGDEGERDAIGKMTLSARDALARDLNLPAPRLTMRFHRTVDDYQRATGRAWFTSGAVVNGDVHMPPLAVLRDRGLLDLTIRRALVHLIADAPLAKRPAWVREGAAAYFADERPARTARRVDARTSCPEDHELLQPVSPGALSNAHARARACFARQIESGKSWRDVK
jgi:hypothetical protein